MRLLFTTEERIKERKAALTEREIAELRAHAEEKMACPDYSVTFHKSPAPSDNIHDYFSEGPYWWPNPKDPNGPFIRRDGEANPERFQHHHHDMEAMTTACVVLAQAGIYIDEVKYLERAAHLLHVWFVDEQTRMNPHLEYAQAIRGICDGRGIGIIDTTRLIKAVVAANLLEYAGGFEKTISGMKAWFCAYIHWLATSKNGIFERDYHNNHANWYNTQIACFAAFVGGDPTPYFDHFLKVIISKQTGEDGSFTDELTRTKSFMYSSFNLDACIVLAQLADGFGVDLWNAVSENGRSIKLSVDFFAPYYDNPFLWKYPQIHVDQGTFDEKMSMRIAARVYGDKKIASVNERKRIGKIPMRTICHIGLVDLI